MLSKRPNDSLYPTTVLVAHPQEVIRMNFPFKKIIKKKKKSTLVFNLGKLGEALITGSVQESSSYIYLCAFQRPTEMQRTFFFFGDGRSIFSAERNELETIQEPSISKLTSL